MQQINATVAHWLRNKEKFVLLPTQCDIDLTNKCDQECFYCIAADFRHTQPVQQRAEDYIDLIDKLYNWRKHSPNSQGSMLSVTFSGGGEPTLLKGYEKVIEYAIDCGFLVSLTTNGSMLSKLEENVDINKIKTMNWIGVDIDSADPITYETIRRSRDKKIFHRMLSSVTSLCSQGVPVDFKYLVNQHNTSKDEVEKIFKLAQSIGIRIVYFRPAIIDGNAYPIPASMFAHIDEASKKYDVMYKLNLTKNHERRYNKCHQMFQFPNFCSDGKIYSCCDHKGDPNYCIGDWLNGDFRDQWLGDRHLEVYNKINTHLCPPCRPNKTNNEIEECLNNPMQIGVLHL